MDLLNNIKAGNERLVNVIVEIPKGSQNKYEYDKKNKVFKLDRVLFSPMHYPGDYGFIPQTHAKDNDPLDALVLLSFPTYPGMLIEAVPVGVLKMKDSGKDDDKILCVAKSEVRLKAKDIKDIDKHVLDEIAHFFAVYKQLEGKKVRIYGWQNNAAARKIIKEAMLRYKKI